MEHLYIISFKFHINSAREYAEPPRNFVFIGFLLLLNFHYGKLQTHNIRENDNMNPQVPTTLFRPFPM